MRHPENLLFRPSSIVDSSNDAIISNDLNGIITSWNKGAEKLWGYSTEEMMGKSVFILVPPGRLAESRRNIETVGAGGIVDHFETVRIRKDGSLVDISISLSPVKKKSGEIVGVSAIVQDISDQKRMEKLFWKASAGTTRS